MEREGLYWVSSGDNPYTEFDAGGRCGADFDGYTGAVELEET